uniref:Putative secreted protein n=1 Tax=Ixodes ricinus TaxID=34613 RepID=A0A6B0U764_IXORI
MLAVMGKSPRFFLPFLCTLCLCVHLQKNRHEKAHGLAPRLPVELLQGATTFLTRTVQGNKMQFIQKNKKLPCKILVLSSLFQIWVGLQMSHIFLQHQTNLW